MDDLPTIAQHAKNYGILPLKKLGQNFLYDQSLCDKIASFAQIETNDQILEIGPGTGGLTRAIIKYNPKKIYALEMDDRCIDLLGDLAYFSPNLLVKKQDALKTTISSLTDEKVKIVANLPYHISTALLMNWLHELCSIDSITIMVQKEVAERLVAEHSTKEYGRLSIITQLMCDTKIMMHVSPDAFYPKPKIWSSIVHLTPKITRPNNKEIEILEKITHAAFSMRRKMLKSSLGRIVPREILQEFDDSKRAENLSCLQYLEIAKRIETLRILE